MAKITWADRTNFKAATNATYEAAATIYNTIKASINALYDWLIPNTWYVNTSGDDSNVGSANFPFLTIQAAHDAAAGNDIIIIMNATYSMNALVTISRPIYIKGPIQSNTNQSHPSLSGTWTLSAPITFENVEFKGAISSSSIKFVSVFSSVFSQSSFTDRNIHLIIRNSEFEINTSSNLGSLNAEDCKFINAVELQVGSGVILNSVAFEGSITSGVDTVSAVTIKNSSISGSLIIDGNLIKENSTVGGTETVSGTTTDEVQTNQKDSAPTIAATVLDIDFAIKRDYKTTAEVAATADFSITLSNNTNAQIATIDLFITNTVIITLPANSIMEEDDTRWNSGTLELTIEGATGSSLELSLNKVGTKLKWIASQIFS